MRKFLQRQSRFLPYILAFLTASPVLTWAGILVSGGAGGSSSIVIGTTPITGGGDTQILYNSGGLISSEAAFTYDPATNTFTVDNGVFNTGANFGGVAGATNSINIFASNICLEGSGVDAFETCIRVVNPTVGDAIVQIPDFAGAVTRTFAFLEAAQTVTGGLTFSDNSFDFTSSANLTFNSSEHVFRFATINTPDSLQFGLGNLSKSFHIIEAADVVVFDYNNAECLTSACLDPTLIIHSANQDTQEYLSFSHDRRAGEIRAGNSTQLASQISLGGTVALAESATAVFNLMIPSGSGSGAHITYTVDADDGTDFQSRSGQVHVSGVNKAGTETCAVYGIDSVVGVVGSANPIQTQDGSGAGTVSAGTLTYAWTSATTPTNGCQFLLNPVSSLTQTTLKITGVVIKNSGTGFVVWQ